MKNKIVPVTFPFDDLSGSKVRPALCLTDSIGVYNHVVVAFISSQISKASEKSDLEILTTNTHFNKTGLKVDSVIRLHRVVTIPSYLIKRQLGILPLSLGIQIKQKLQDLFQLY